MTTAPLASGSMLASRWIIGGRLGRSDAAEVYEAEEASQRRFAALKLFAPALAVEPAWGEYVALARAISELPGDGIARAYDTGIEATLGRPYVASERITFPSLARYAGERGPLPLRVVAQALATLGSALDAAHAAGIVHGGLKPQNVFISFDNPSWARLTDFGQARLRAAAGRPTSMLGWSAPELGSGSATPAGDRYALGLICFFAATGLSWYNALKTRDEPVSSKQHARLASERAKSQGGELDAHFDPWFTQALDADPARRFETASQMARAFIDAFTGAPTTEMEARSFANPLAETLPLRGSTPPSEPPSAPPSSGPLLIVSDGPRLSSVPAPPSTSVPAPRSSSVPAPYSSVPAPGGKRKAAVTLWLGAAGIALLAILAIWWLSRA